MLNLMMSLPDGSVLYAGNYDFVLVSLSVTIAIFASYAALLVSQHVAITTNAATRRLWIAGGSLCLGIGVWAMHFVGMLAFNLPCSTSYNASLTLLSTIPSILASALALKTISRRELSPAQLATGGLLIGAGIGTMHYSGMAAMRLNGLIRYDIKLFLLSLVVAVALSTMALWIKFRLQSLPARWNKWSVIASAVVMGLAVSGMHYTAMAAAYFIRNGDTGLTTSGIAPAFLAAIVLAATGLIIVITIVASYVGRPNLPSLTRSYRLIGLLIACWVGIAWLSADYYYSRLASNLYQQETQLATQKAEQVAGNLDENIKLLKGIALIFARDADTLRALRAFGVNAAPATMKKLKQRWPHNEMIAELNDNIGVAATHLGADSIYILNAAGDCIASSNAGKPESFVGANYADRDYFRQARRGEPGHQYTTGRISKTPGFFYSSPVFETGHFLGAVVVKRNVTQFSHWTNQANAFITDANGVIVLASDKRIEHHYLPDTPITKLATEQILLQYSIPVPKVPEPLIIIPWQKKRFPSAVLIKGEPVVLAARNLPGDVITVYASRSLNEIVRLDHERIWLFLLLASTGSTLIIAASAVVLYLRESQRTAADLRIAASAFEAQEGMLITDARGVILRVNKAFTVITGYSSEDAIGQTTKLLHSGRQDAYFYEAMWDKIGRTGSWEGEIWNKRKNGEIYPEYLTISAVSGKDGIVTNYVGTFNDITTSKSAEDEIKLLAFYDALTGLPNRRLLTDRLRQALASSTRNEQQGALLFIDLDNFKALNDTLGHDVGDLLLQQVSQRLINCVREGDTVARLGGDEFVVMLENLSLQTVEAAAQTEAAANKIIAHLNQPYQLASYECHSTPSIGATLFNSTEVGIDELFKQSDIAMYQAKKAGRNTLRFFDPVMQEAVNARALLEGELRNALEYRQFHLHYQIQVDSLHQPFGAEALIRWIHPERGMVSPAEFIPLAEETGLILPIGLWVLDTACAQLKTWEQDTRTRNMILAVNVSARQFHQSDFVTQVKTTVQRHAITPALLKLELTESLLLENIESIVATMTALKEIGVKFSLDDFGTGYSSLQYLKRLPLSQLKIDQSFVRDIASDSSDRAIVRTIIAMAHSLNLDIIAEGVETEEQRQQLLDKGCTHFQGYLFGKPVPIAVFEAALN